MMTTTATSAASPGGMDRDGDGLYANFHPLGAISAAAGGYAHNHPSSIYGGSVVGSERGGGGGGRTSQLSVTSALTSNSHSHGHPGMSNALVGFPH